MSKGSAAACYPVVLEVADDSASWSSAGFNVVSDTVALGEITIRLVGRSNSSGGIVGWSFSGLPPGVNSIHGIPTSTTVAVPASGDDDAARPHPNGAVGVDTIVFQSPDADESIAQLAAIGVRPIRETSRVRKGVRQVIFRPSKVIIELIESKNTKSNPPSLFGLTLVTEDVDHTHKVLGSTTKPPWPAVQPGRRMTVVRHSDHNMSVAVAFMSPHVRGLEGSSKDREKLFEQRARAQESELQNRETEESHGAKPKPKL